MILYKNIKLEKAANQKTGKVKYIINDKECFVEEAAILYYENLGYKALWTEDAYWCMLLALLFWDIIFAKVKGAVSAIAGGVRVEIDVYDNNFEQLFFQTIQINGMPADLFAPEFYPRRKELIKNRIQEILHCDIEQELKESYKNNYHKTCRLIYNWDRYTIEELLIPVKIVDKEKILKILERLIINLNENRSGLPDLIVYSDKDFFFSEVKSEKDKISEKQSDWHSFLSETLGLKVELFLINRSEAQVEKIEEAQFPNIREIVVSFTSSTSSKREEALRFIKEQPSYFTQGEGKEERHGAKFKNNEIDKLYFILDLTSGWKTQKIEIDGEIVKPADLRNSLWCFREKNKLNASSDYCKESMAIRQTNLGAGVYILMNLITNNGGIVVILIRTMVNGFLTVIKLKNELNKRLIN
ncbi:MAG: VRR-NUC domain-containing protein [Candidatus Omnitrophica bacterium]|nr:VRR-NUC domain-containing protein [Candidatus Omnitrophota bacterium]